MRGLQFDRDRRIGHSTGLSALTVTVWPAELTPGWSTREGYMPLNDFIDETMGLCLQELTPSEILVERVGFPRWAERDGHFDRAIQSMFR